MRSYFSQILFILLSCLVNLSRSVLFNGYEIRDLYTNDDTFITDSDRWTATALRNGVIYSLCGGTYLMGGFDVLGEPDSLWGVQGYNFERVYNDLPDHNIIYYTISLWLLDSWDSIPPDYFQLEFDSFLVEGWGVGIEYFEVNSCGRDWPDLANMKIFGQVSHSGSSLTLRVISQLDSFAQDESLGFRDVRLIFAESEDMNVNKLCGLSSIPLPTNQCNCSYGEYFDEIYTMTCVGCDTSCKSCFGATANECYECEAGYSFVESKCIKCDENCAACFGPNANQCIDCPIGMSLFDDGICISGCLNTEIYDTVLVCDSPCLTVDQFYFYENQTCSDDCDPPFVAETLWLGVQVCVSPCDAEEGFLYWDGTCNSLCPLPLQGRNNGTSNCLYNCQPDEFLYWDGSCSDTCESPLSSGLYKDRLFCQSPCPDPADYIYWNGTCKNTCLPPLFGYNDGKANHCALACPEGKFISQDGFSCLESCDLPFRAREEEGVLFCDYPCHRSEFLYWDGSCQDSCPEPYHAYSSGPGKQFCSYLCEQYGDYFYPREGECLPDCVAPYIPRVQVIDEMNWYAVCLDPAVKGQTGNSDDNGNHPNDPLYFTITTIKIASEKVAGIFIILDIVISLLRDSHVMILFLVIKVLNFVRYIDIRVPPQLVQDFESYDQNHFYLNFGPAMSREMQEKFTKSSLPMVFERPGLHSRFLVNFFKPITSFVILLGVIIVIGIVQSFLRRKASNQYVLIKMMLRRFEVFMRWNLIILLVICNIDEIILYGIIEWKTMRMDSDQDSISLLISLGMAVLSLAAIIAPFYLLDRIYQTRFKVLSNQANEPYFNLLRKIEGVQLLWKDFKDSTGSQRSFLSIYLLRIAIIYLIIGFLYKYPLLQTVLISSTSLGMLTFMSIVKPFMKRLDFIQSVIYEIFMMISIGSTLILAVLDRSHAKADQLWIFLGDCIMFCNIWISLTAVIFFVYRFYIEIERVWRFYKVVDKPVGWREFAILFLKDDDPIIQELKKNKRTSRRLDLRNLEREIEKKNFDRYHIKLFSPETSIPENNNNDESQLPCYIRRKSELRIRRSLFGLGIQSADSETSPFKTVSTFDGEKSPYSLGSIENSRLENKIRIFNDIKKILQDVPGFPQNVDLDGREIHEKNGKFREDKTPKRRKLLWKDLETIKEVDSMEASEVKIGLQTNRLRNLLQDPLKADLSLLSIVKKRLSSETIIQKIEVVDIMKEKDDLIKKKLIFKESQRETLFE